MIAGHDLSHVIKITGNGFPVFKENGILTRLLNPNNHDDVRLYQEFRYRYWVEEFKYLDEPDHGEKREYDKYDDHSVHFGVFDESGRLAGYSRFILPGKHGLQVYNEFPGLADPRHGSVRSIGNSVESSRLIIERELGAKRHHAAQMMYKLKYQFMKRCEFVYWYHVSELKLIRALRRQKYPFEVLGEGKDYQGAVCYPAVMSLVDVDFILKREAPAYFQWLNEGLDEINGYNDLVSRNTAFIAPEQQYRIKNKRILFAGCGLGSNIAVLSARLGFTKFIVADFDQVETSNLNRQAFSKKHVGVNKALALKDVLLSLNPNMEVEAFPEKLSVSNIDALIDKSDLIVNTVDFDSTCYNINDLANRQGKPVFFPLNIGFGGFLLVFTNETIKLQQMTAGANGNTNFFTNLARSIKGYRLPDYVAPLLSSINNYEDLGFLPQTGVAANITASLTAIAMISYIVGWPLRLAPYVISSDAMFSAKQPAEVNIYNSPSKKKRYSRKTSVVHNLNQPPRILNDLI